MAITIAGITVPTDPNSARLVAALDKLASASVALLIPTWALLIIQSQVLIVKYMMAHNEQPMGGPQNDFDSL